MSDAGKRKKKRLVFSFGEKQLHFTDLFLFCDIIVTRVREEKEEKRRSLSRRVFWNEDASAEKADWGERCVGFDRE